uniref:Uncharacterized protein n=1 Tax=Zea mays TaxID=4577 RepID=C4J4M5_MAIZE|nr:unknown [Zea mays]
MKGERRKKKGPYCNNNTSPSRHSTAAFPSRRPASQPARSMNGGRGSQFPCGAAASVYSEHQVQQPEEHTARWIPTRDS